MAWTNKTLPKINLLLANETTFNDLFNLFVLFFLSYLFLIRHYNFLTIFYTAFGQVFIYFNMDFLVLRYWRLLNIIFLLIFLLRFFFHLWVLTNLHCYQFIVVVRIKYGLDVRSLISWNYLLGGYFSIQFSQLKHWLREELKRVSPLRQVRRERWFKNRPCLLNLLSLFCFYFTRIGWMNFRVSGIRSRSLLV